MQNISTNIKTLFLSLSITITASCIAPDEISTGEAVQGVTSNGPFAISMTPNAPLVQGTQTTFTITATNDTTDTAAIGVFADFGTDTVNALPASCVRNGPSIMICPATNVAAGESITYSPRITPLNAGQVTYGASDSTLANGVTSSQQSVQDIETVAPGATDLQITGSSNQGSPVAGTVFTYTFLVKNNGPFATSGGVSFADALPGTLALDSVTTDTGTCTAGAEIDCALGDLAVGKQATIRINASANVAATKIVNTATAELSAAQADRNTANNSVSVTVTSH